MFTNEIKRGVTARFNNQGELKMKMNKKIITLAITSLFAAPVAMADTANVNIYGRFSVAADYATGTSVVNTANGLAPSGLVESRNRISSHNSYLGFKGTEDLGDGLSAVWQYETLIAVDRQNIDNVNTSQAGSDFVLGRSGGQSKRNTFAGLVDKTYGSLTFGLQDTPLKISFSPANVYPRTYVSDYRAVFAVPGALTNIRAENSLLYTSPNLGGVVVKALYGARNEGGNGTLAEPTINSYSVGYSNSSFSGILAYEYTRFINDPVTAVASNLTVTPIVPGVAAVTSKVSTVRSLRAAVGYTFGNAKLGAAIEKNNNATLGAPAAATASGGGVAAVDAMAYYLSGSYKIGLNTLKVAFARRLDNKAVSSANGTNTDDGAIHYTFGVDRALSKRTSVYLLSTAVRNGRDGTFGIGGQPTGIAPIGAIRSGTARDVSLGVIVDF
jgi:predicted porin